MEYTDKDIQNAKAFIRKRVETEISMQDNLDELLMEAARRIVKISYRYNVTPSLFRFSANPNLKKEVDEVIAWLREKLYEVCESLSILVEEEDKVYLVAYINRESYGKTLKERIGIYTNRFKYELEAFIAAGLLYKYSIEKLLVQIRFNLGNPYNNRIFKDAVKTDMLITSRIATGGISYGQGRSNSSRNSLDRLTRTAVGEAWMIEYFRKAERQGKKGFYSFRGSSYPCSFCDSMVGFHPLSEYTGEWHLNCRCFFVFV